MSYTYIYALIDPRNNKVRYVGKGNNLKNRLEKNWVLEQIPWCKEGFWIEHRKKKEGI